MKKIGKKALRQNQALKPLEVLIGEWQTIGSHPYIPNMELHGRISFEWIEGGAFLIMRSEIDHPKIPDGIAIFGTDDEAKTFFMMYFDERGVSRKFEVFINKNEIKWRRDNPHFSQRVTLTIEGDKLVSHGEMSRDGGVWEDDLSSVGIRN